jgi:hypothetical protein
VHRMQAWAGQSAALARAEPAAEVVRRLWMKRRPYWPNSRKSRQPRGLHEIGSIGEKMPIASPISSTQVGATRPRQTALNRKHTIFMRLMR